MSEGTKNEKQGATHDGFAVSRPSNIYEGCLIGHLPG